MKSKAVIALAALLVAASAASAGAQTWRTVSKSRQFGSQDYLDVSIEYAVGRFELKKGSDRLLYRLNSKYDEEVFRLRSSYMQSDGHGRLRIDLDGREDWKHLKDYDLEAGSLNVDLTDATPIALHVKIGAAEAVLDLGGLMLEEVLYETGASDTHISFSEPNRVTAEDCTFKAGAAEFTVEQLGNSGCRNIEFAGGVGEIRLDFTGEWDHDASSQIKVGLGSIEIRVPAELGVKIHKSTFLMSFDAPGFEKHGGDYYSGNWDTAAHRLVIEISGAFGSIEVDRV
jgi:hypothetical protein